ncbi:MAG: sulfite exporter TauE/SafE family protein [Planctomycetota bacterium]|jgi:uncharacterized membrane protein YfcA
MDITLFAVGSLVILFAFFLRSFTGFGGALISIPLLSLFLDPIIVIPAEALLEVSLSLLLLKGCLRKINWATLSLVLFGAIIGTLIGAYILKTSPVYPLKKTLGVVIIVFGFFLLVPERGWLSSPPAWVGLVAGLIGGIAGGTFGASGPPFVAYLACQLDNKDILRATLIGLFTFDFCWRVCVFSVSGLITFNVIRLALCFMPALVLGTIIGSKAHRRIPGGRFSQVVAGLIVISGAVLVFS